MSESESQPEDDQVDPINKLKRFEDAWAAMEYLDSDQFGSHDGEAIVPQEAPSEMPDVDEEDREPVSPFVFRFDVSTERGVTEPLPFEQKAWSRYQAPADAKPNYWQAKRDTIKQERSKSPVTRRIVASAQEWTDQQTASTPPVMPKVDGPKASPAPQQPQGGVPFMRGLDPGPGLYGGNQSANPANAPQPFSPQEQRTKFSFEPGAPPTGQPFTATQTADSEQMLDTSATIDDFGNEMLRFAQSVSWSIRSINAQLSDITRAIQAEGGDYQ